jgi:4-methylaminobutanoate oxidase (formaldehyde-forming)
MAEWLIAGRPPFDVWRHDCRRLSPLDASEGYIHDAAQDALARHYDVHYPGEEHPIAVGVRASPLHDRLAQAGAVFGMKFGWSRPNWFAQGGAERAERASYARPNWFDAVGLEHRAVRERVGLIDQTARGKFELEGRNALAALQRLASADCDTAPGSLVRALLLNEAGGIEADLVVARLAEERFYLVGAAGTTRRDFDWLARRLPEEGAYLRDASSERAAILLAGPKARDLLARVVAHGIAELALPHHGAAELDVGYGRGLVLRYSDWGEPAYELHLPFEQAAAVYDWLWREGASLGLANVGHRALDSLRIEKATPLWGVDLSPDVTPLEAGLEARIARDTGAFLGHSALERMGREGTPWRFAIFALDDERPVFGGEAIVKDGTLVGSVTSAHYGYTVGRSILLGYARAEALEHDGAWEIEAFSERFAAERLETAPYDPKNARLGL